LKLKTCFTIFVDNDGTPVHGMLEKNVFYRVTFLIVSRHHGWYKQSHLDVIMEEDLRESSFQPVENGHSEPEGKQTFSVAM